MSLPVLPIAADTRSITERLNRLIADFNARRTPVAVARLPANPATGETWMASDAATTAFNAVVSGGGTAVVAVRWDGAAWRVC